jgi:hypothetical protein
MQTAPGQLVVRQHERFRCALPARVAVGPECAGRVVMAAADAAAGEPEVAVEVIDCSGGGVGLKCGTFFPKLCILNIRVRSGADGSGELLEFSARVQRAAMTDRTPSYYIGVAFLGEGAEHERRVTSLIAIARRSMPPGQPGADQLTAVAAEAKRV